MAAARLGVFSSVLAARRICQASSFVSLVGEGGFMAGWFSCVIVAEGSGRDSLESAGGDGGEDGS